MDNNVEPNLWYPCRRFIGSGEKSRYLRLTMRGFDEAQEAIDWFVDNHVLKRNEQEHDLEGGWGTTYFVCVGHKTDGAVMLIDYLNEIQGAEDDRREEARN